MWDFTPPAVLSTRGNTVIVSGLCGPGVVEDGQMIWFFSFLKEEITA